MYPEVIKSRLLFRLKHIVILKKNEIPKGNQKPCRSDYFDDNHFHYQSEMRQQKYLLLITMQYALSDLRQQE